MKKFLIYIYLFCGLLAGKAALAIECPHATEWTHIKGQPWQLSQRMQQEGWEASTVEGAQSSDLTELPLDKHLHIGLMQTGMRFTTCAYSLQTGDHSMAIVAINQQHRVNTKSLKPPFYCFHQHCDCDTTAGEPQMCRWEWS